MLGLIAGNGSFPLIFIKEAKASVLAVEVEKTLILELPEVVKSADENNICIVAV